MAGIGVKLQKIYDRRTILANLAGFGYSTMVTIAPMFVVIGNGCRTSSWTAERGKHPGVRKTDPCKAGVSDPGILQIPEKGGIKDELCADQTLFY